MNPLILEALLNLSLKAIENLPQVITLTADGIAYVQKLVADIAAIKANPNATLDDVNKLIAEIDAASDQIQKL